MPFKILQSNHRVAEVQFICDDCGKLVRTSLITKEEVDDPKTTKIICYQCKEAKSKKE